MNVLEAFIKKFGQLIILILGLPCTNKSELAKKLSADLNIQLLKINDFLIKDKYIETEVENTKFKLYENVENYDWDALNNKVGQLKTNGIIIYGNFLDSDKINFNIDVIYFYSMNNNLCKKLLNEKKLFDESLDDAKKEIYFNNIFIPSYNQLKQKFKINKFFNIKDDTNLDNIYDELFDSVINFIESKLYKPNQIKQIALQRANKK
jgi:hypothetical protein